jgi:hypothetical protein
LYVGKAALLGIRLGAYYKHTDIPRDTSCTVIDSRLADKGASGMRVVLLNNDLKFFAPALEWFLIHYLDPPLNTQGRGWQMET